MGKMKACPMCHREPPAPGRKFCGRECQFEWEEYDRHQEDRAAAGEARVVFPESRR